MTGKVSGAGNAAAAFSNTPSAKPQTAVHSRINKKIATSVDGLLEQLNAQIDNLSQNEVLFDWEFSKKIIGKLSSRKKRAEEIAVVTAKFKQSLLVFAQNNIRQKREVAEGVTRAVLDWLKQQEPSNKGYDALLLNWFTSIGQERSLEAQKIDAAYPVTLSASAELEKVQQNTRKYFKKIDEESVWVAKMTGLLEGWVLLEGEIQPLPVQDQEELIQFLTYCYGNQNLYKQLKSSGAEDQGAHFVRDFCFLTHADAARDRLDEILKSVADDPLIIEIRKGVEAVQDPEKGLEADLIQMFTASQGRQDPLQNAYHAWKTTLDAILPEKRMAWRLSEEMTTPSCKSLLEDIRREAEKLPSERDTVELVSEYLKQLGSLKTAQQTLVDSLQDHTPKLRYSDLRRAYSHQLLFRDYQSVLRKLCPTIVQHKLLHGFFEGCAHISSSIDKLEQAQASFPFYESGDVLLRDEVEYRSLHGSKSYFYSQFSLLNPAQALQLLWGLVTLGPFEVSGYAGSRVHASIVTAKQESVSLSEIEKRLQSYPITLESTTHDVVYRPNFERLLRPDVKLQLVNTLGSEQNVITVLQDRYKRQVNEIFETLQALDVQITNSKFKAGAAFIKAWARKHLPERLRVVASELIDWLLKEPTGLIFRMQRFIYQIQGHEVEEDLANFEARRFCSEFVAEIIKKTINALNQELREEFELTTDALYEVIDVPVEELHPSYLEEKLLPYFDQVTSVPPFTRYVVQSVAHGKEKVGKG